MPREVRFLADAKTLISVSEAECASTVLADITVVQGEPSNFMWNCRRDTKSRARPAQPSIQPKHYLEC